MQAIGEMMHISHANRTQRRYLPYLCKKKVRVLTKPNPPTMNEAARHTLTTPTPDTISVNPRVRIPLENDIVPTSKRREKKKHMHYQGLNPRVSNAAA